jgi:endonuclease G, mitochondrial
VAKRSSSSDGGFIFKTGAFAVLAALAFWLFNQFSGKKEPENAEPKTEQDTPRPRSAGPVESRLNKEACPAEGAGEQVEHTYFTLAYSEPHEQAAWVAYELTRDRLNNNWADRPNSFRPDQAVSTESATPRDYSGSGYDKGHLCPAADMAFDSTAIDETFFMSNMSPQLRGFNAGIWRELEELVRDWARKFKRVYIVTGPILTNPKEQIGFSKVSVPIAYYKVLYAPEQHKAIGFMLPNQVSDKPVMDYSCSIDKVEKTTGIDFFPTLLGGLNEELEASFDPVAWPINQSRYERRIVEWNIK